MDLTSRSLSYLVAKPIMLHHYHLLLATCNFLNYGDKLIIKLERILSEGSIFRIAIVYSAKPRKGFYFIEPDKYYPKKNLQAWTQGQTIESKYWFPCLDHPLVKFESEISVIVPLGFIDISNGKLLMSK